jgi:hypothetical protein
VAKTEPEHMLNKRVNVMILFNFISAFSDSYAVRLNIVDKRTFICRPPDNYM